MCRHAFIIPYLDKKVLSPDKKLSFPDKNVLCSDTKIPLKKPEFGSK